MVEQKNRKETEKKPKKNLKTGIIRQKVLIPNSSPDRVYKALMSSREHSELTGSPAKMSGRVGGKFTAWDGYITGRNISLVNGKKIEQDWRTTEFPEGYGDSILRITLKKKGNSTELSMNHSKVPASQVSSYEEGWFTSYWSPMKEYFAKKR